MFESSWQLKVLISLIIWVIIRFSMEESLLKRKLKQESGKITELNSKKDT